MLRTTAILVLVTLMAPAALAAAPTTELPEANDAPSMPDLRPLGAAIAHGATAAADATGDAFAAVGHAIANVAAAAGRALVAIGHGLASLAAALGAAASFLFTALGHALAAVASALAAAASFLGARLLQGGRFVAAHPKESAIIAGSATGMSLIAYAAKKWWLGLFVPLYSRLAKSDMLENSVRASVFDLVKQNPGIHPSAIADTLGLGWGTVVYHLARLENSSLITPRTARGRKCYFVVGGELDQNERATVAAMATDKARAIVDALRAQPGISQKDLAESLGMSQALASWHVKRLVASGILVSVRDGRSNLLHVAEHVPVVAAPATALAA